MTIPTMRDGRSASDRRIDPATIASRKNKLIIRPHPPPGGCREAVY